MLFDVFPSINYKNDLIRNILVDTNSLYQELVSSVNLVSYRINDYPRPEVLSYKLYNSTQYEWTFLTINKITDPFHGWLKSEDQVYETAELLYPVTNENPNGIYGTHHFIDYDDDYIYYDIVYSEINGGWYHKDDTNFERIIVVGQANIYPVTNIDYELEENEKRREILIIPPAQISKFIDAMHRLINERYNKRY